MARTVPSHGINTGSIPVRATIIKSGKLPLFIIVIFMRESNQGVVGKVLPRIVEDGRPRAKSRGQDRRSPHCIVVFCGVYF